MIYIVKEILISGKKFTDTNFERLKKCLVYIKKNL